MKALLFLLVIGFWVGPVSAGENEDNLIDRSEIDKLYSLINPEDSIGLQKRNAEYLITSLIKKNDLFHEFVYRHDEFRNKLRKLQSANSVCKWNRYLKKNPITGDVIDLSFDGLYVGESAVDRLAPEMLVRIMYTIEYLSDDQRVMDLGGLIEIDLEDRNNKYVLPREKGGVVLIDRGHLVFLPIPDIHAHNLNGYFSSAGEWLEDNVASRYVANNYYLMPSYALEQIKNVGEFHLHATQRVYARKREDIKCGPSIGISKGKHTVDIGVALQEAQMYGEWHGFVISSIATRTFSTHYFASLKKVNGDIEVYVVNLPISIY
jgi:hypothetical protein